MNYQLFSDSVENECWLGNTGISDDAIAQLISRMNLNEHRQGLSGGQKQRLAIAVAVAAGKKILVMDEPTSGLDYQNMKVVSELLGELAKNGIICIVVSHDVEFLSLVCNRLLLLEENRATEIESMSLQSFVMT